MDRHFDCDNCRDFMVMTCNGELCPNKPIQLRSIGGDKITMITYEDQVRKLCKNNNVNILEILIEIYEEIMNDMLMRGNNTPVFKKKVSSVINQWNGSPEYEDLFRLQEKNFDFNYRDVIECNARVLELNKKLEGLERLISIASDELYSEILSLQSESKEIDMLIKDKIQNLEKLSSYYEPKYPNILLDLSTKPKSYYTEIDTKDPISKMVYHKNFKGIPENVPKIFSNSIFIPNMITKETDYILELLKNLKGNVRNKQILLAEIKGNVPERTQMEDPIFKFFKYFVDSSDEEGYQSGDLSDELSQSSEITPLTEKEVKDINEMIEEVEQSPKKEVKESSKVNDNKKGKGIQVETGDDGEHELYMDKSPKLDRKPERSLIDLAQKKGDKYELSFF